MTNRVTYRQIQLIGSATLSLTPIPTESKMRIGLEFKTEEAAQEFFNTVPKELQDVLNVEATSSHYSMCYNIDQHESPNYALWKLIRESMTAHLQSEHPG